jgi:hypothetical protein
MKLQTIYFNDHGRVHAVVVALPSEWVKFLEGYSATLGFDFFEVDDAVTLTAKEVSAVQSFVGSLSPVTSPNYEITSAIFTFFDFVVQDICKYAEEVIEEWQED